MSLAIPNGAFFHSMPSIYGQHTGRYFSSAASALVSAAFCVGSIIGPQTFKAKDAPQYIPAKISVLATQSAGIMIAIMTRLYYGWQNSQKPKTADTTIKDVEWLNCKCYHLGFEYQLTGSIGSNRQRESFFPVSVLGRGRRDVDVDTAIFFSCQVGWGCSTTVLFLV